MPILNATEIEILLTPAGRRIISTLRPDPEAVTLAGHPRAGVETDCHSYREIMLVLAGSAQCMLEDKLYAGTPGSIFLFNNRQRHDRGYPPGAPSGIHLWLFPLPDALSGDMVRVTTQGWQSISHYWQKNAALMALFNDAWTRCFAAPSAGNQAELEAMLGVLCANVARRFSGEESADREFVPRQQEAIEAVTKHLAQTLGAGDSINGLARLTGFSRAHFLRLFRQYAGCTPQEYIDNLRTSAHAELTRQGLRRKEIADALGFSSGAALAHWCRQRRLG